MDYDMEDYHCGHCKKYVGPEAGFYGAAERDDGEYQRIYCNKNCCRQSEPELFT